MHNYLPLSAADDLDHNAKWYADVPAYVQDNRQITYRELRDRAAMIAAAIEQAGVRRQDRVGLLSQNSIEFGEIMAAAQYSGFLFAPVNWRLAPLEMLYIINDSAPKIFFFEAQYLAAIAAIRDQIKTVERYVCIGGATDWAESYEDFLGAATGATLSYRALEADIQCLIYTSGTTGRPKGCIWGHREYRQLCQTVTWLWGVEESDRILIVMPMFHIGAMALVLAGQVRGSTVHLHRQFDPAAALETIARERITALHLAPTMVQMLLEAHDRKPADVSSVEAILYSAAPMPVPVLRKAIETFGCKFLNLFGQSEICSFGLSPKMHRPYGSEREQRWLTSVGKPYPNVQGRVVDEHGNDCAPNVPGEIIAKSVAMFRGYWNNHPATLETIRDGWCYTGDMGLIDEDGLLYLVDRKKDMIISGGENIYSREVENAVVEHAAVSECAVIGIPDPTWGENVCAIVVLKTDATATEAEIIEFAKTRIASYKKPKKVIFIGELPKLVTGKINKIELRNLFAKL